MIKRDIQEKVASHIENNKILILKAPANIGRMELIQSVIGKEQQILVFDFKEKKIINLFKSISLQDFFALIEDSTFVIFKEAQLLNNLQSFVEAILFQDKFVNLICICSYEPNLDDLLMEALNQQELILEIQAPSFKEIANEMGLIPFEKQLDERLIFGNYPASMELEADRKDLLLKYIDEIANYSFSKNDRINKKENLKKLLQFVSFNIGKHLSYNQIGQKCALDNETVERYISMLEKAYILIKVPVLHTEQKYELQKTHSFYFFDNGIRNAFIQNFNDLDFRNDCDELWKNWLISERTKKLLESNSPNKLYFWITHTKQSVDLIEIGDSTQKAYQIMWDKTDKFKIPNLFTSYYPKINCYKINKSSYWSFLIK